MPATVHKEIHTLFAAFSKAVKMGLIGLNPCTGLSFLGPPEHRERVASDKDIEKLLVASGWDGKLVPTTGVQLVIAAFFICM